MKRCRDSFEENLEMVFDLFPRLKERMDQAARTLSEGEAQMLAIARAMITNPRLLMIRALHGTRPDPSVEGLPVDIEAQGEGVTILLVEQHVPVALKVSDRAYVLENGRIVLSGTSEEVASNEKVREHYLGI